MELIKQNESLWGPFDLLADLQDDLNRVFSRSLTKQREWARTFSPSVDVCEENDHYVLHADLPGLQKEDFSISVEGSSLTLKGARKEVKENESKGARYTERLVGSFLRTMDFPTEIEADKIKAAFKNGVLEVILPKSEKSKPTQVQVEIQ